MQQYDYPVKYFCTPALTRFTRKDVMFGLDIFNKRHATNRPITGETDIDGVKIDFNCGLRLQIPRGDWHVCIADGASDVVCFDEDVSAVTLVSLEKFFIEWEISLWFNGEPVFYHKFDPTGQKIHFDRVNAMLGDTIVLLPYIEEFRRAFNCVVTCKIPAVFEGIVKNYYPNLTIVDELPDDAYACCYVSGWNKIHVAATDNFRAIPMELSGHSLFNMPKVRKPSKVIYTPTEPRLIKEKYVCIGVQASGSAKCWLNPDGWSAVIEYLKSLGYRVLCIDRERKHVDDLGIVEMPDGVEDFSGDYNLIDRVNQLAYANFFIGVSSGLSWLAWAVDIPVVLISGITERWYEFESAYRVSNPLVCHGCFNKFNIDIEKCLRCLEYRDTDRMYECSKKISPRQVIDAIDRLIADKARARGAK